MAWKLRPYNKDEIELIDSLIKEGEDMFGRSHSRGHLVQEYVQKEMIERGLRVKINPIVRPKGKLVIGPSNTNTNLHHYQSSDNGNN